MRTIIAFTCVSTLLCFVYVRPCVGFLFGSTSDVIVSWTNSLLERRQPILGGSRREFIVYQLSQPWASCVQSAVPNKEYQTTDICTKSKARSQRLLPDLFICLVSLPTIVLDKTMETVCPCQYMPSFSASCRRISTSRFLLIRSYM